jgi:hypothetical protein
METLAFRALADDLIVCVGGDKHWSDEDWQGYLRLLRGLLPPLLERDRPIRVFVFAGETAPDAKQRGELKAVFGGSRQQTATVTNSKLAKYIITALAWLGLPGRAFSPEQADSAAAHLGLTASELHEARATAQVLAARVGGSACVDAALRAMVRAQAG